MYLCSTLVSACDSYVESALKFNFQIKLIQQSKSSSLIHWVKLAFGIWIFNRKDVISIRYVKPTVWRSFRKLKNQRYFISLGRIYKIIPEINQSSFQAISIWNIFPEQTFSNAKHNILSFLTLFGNSLLVNKSNDYTA